MGLFRKKEKKLNAFMRHGLPLVFAVAWAPMVWMLLAAVLGPVMERLFSSWQPIVAVLVALTALVTGGLSVMFRRFGLKIFGEKSA
jgi:hypothetical protein